MLGSVVSKAEIMACFPSQRSSFVNFDKSPKCVYQCVRNAPGTLVELNTGRTLEEVCKGWGIKLVLQSKLDH